MSLPPVFPCRSKVSGLSLLSRVLHHVRDRRSKRGYALILVLSVVVLCVVMVTAFLSRSTQERSAAAGNKASADARRLADIAVSLVQGQINHATTQGSDIAWVSQPGMVRTFTSTGDLRNAYKLFSAPNMVSSNVSLTDDLPPADWPTSSAVWVDLNAPVTSGGVKNFPILSLSKTQSDADPTPDKPMTVSAGTINPVEGFGLTTTPPGATDYQPAPMPVRWLYVLEDGQLVAPPAGATGKTVTISGATATNPIVGRIAFWTDDESAKVNINTAGEGTFWDVPRGYTEQEVFGYAYRQPANGEYQRYPGHPAMVSLSSIFPFTDPATDSDPSRHVEDYLKLTPRYTYAGSKAGTVSITAIKADPTNSIKAKDDERLYTSLDEMLFTPARGNNSFLTRPLLDSRKFFLTANSRAPETNLFNLPRIAVWPIWEISAADWMTRTTPYDRTMLFCSSTGPSASTQHPYIFQRKVALDPDYDMANIPRNGELFSYMQYLTSHAIPGVQTGGATFASKYPQDRDNILTQMFDYVRCTNLNDSNLSSTAMHFAKYDANAAGGVSGAGAVAPIHGPNGSQGLGRWHTLRQLSLIFTACADFANTSSNIADNKMLCEPFPGGAFVPLTNGQRRVQMMILPELFCVMTGWRTVIPELTMEIKGLDQFRINGTPLQMPATSYTVINRPTQAISGDDLGMDMVAHGAVSNKLKTFRSLFPFQPAAGETAYGPGGTELYPWLSCPVTVSGTTLNFTGGDIVVNLYAGLTSSRKLVQTLRIKIQDGTFPVPTLGTDKRQWSCFSDGGGIPGMPYGRTYVNRAGSDSNGISLGGSISNLVNTATDVIRAYVPKYSDYRYTTTLRDDDKMFVPHNSYSSSTLLTAWLVAGGKLFSNQLTGVGHVPNSAAQLTSGVTLNPCEATGDFDLGPGIAEEGACGNKPDDGDLFQESAGNMLGNTLPEQLTIPYYRRNRTGNNIASYFSPNRIIPSAIMFGSLVTGARSDKPWRTLLFRPVSVPEENAHYGLNSPRDHYLLDMFWMPVVTPYAISDRFSTSGKINMNYQILPFTYIERSTGLHAVLKAERVMQIPVNVSIHPNLNSGGYPAVPARKDRKVIDVNATLQQFRDRFSQADVNRNVFITPSEVCDIRLVPEGQTLAQAAAWKTCRQTADNVREKPYSTIYPKLTTKSNTFLVHFRAQSLKKAIGTSPNTWTEGRDVETSEYRGSTAIERFINPDADIPDYAALSTAGDITAPTLDTFYKWRIIRNTQFAP